MNKKILFLAGVFVMAHSVAMGAIAIKKAAPVATQQKSGVESATSLLPTVMNLVSGVQQINQQTQALTVECVPTNQEIADVNALVKEWAKTGSMSAQEAFNSLGVSNCSSTGSSYESLIRSFGDDLDSNLMCFDSFTGKENDNMIWKGYPKAAKTYYCSDGGIDQCSEKNKVYITNMYEIFNLIDFSEQDYTESEAKLASKLMSKIENCSPVRLSAKKRALMGNFVISAIGNMGQKTNTGAIMDVVGSVANSSGSGAGGMLQSLGGIATQFLGGM